MSLHPWQTGGPKVVLVLVGLIASGKSTFAKALEQHIPNFRRCNQDDLGGRRQAVEKLARQSLFEGQSACIDRTNVDESQRATWINIASEFPGTQIWCLVFDTPVPICSDRLDRRTDHPTIRSPEQGKWVLQKFAQDLQYPTASEGFDRILHLKPTDHPSPNYTREDLEAILVRLETSLPLHGQRHHQPNLHDFLGPQRRINGPASSSGSGAGSRGFGGRSTFRGGSGFSSWQNNGRGRGGRVQGGGGGQSYRAQQSYGLHPMENSTDRSLATGDWRVRAPIASEAIIHGDMAISSSVHQTSDSGGGSKSHTWRSQNQSAQGNGDGSSHTGTISSTLPANARLGAPLSMESPPARTCDERENREIGVEQRRHGRGNPQTLTELGSEENPIVLD